MTDPVKIEEYNKSWPGYFHELEAKIWPVVKDLAIGIEHIGGTSVPGLVAKPIIDIDIIAPKITLTSIIQRLQGMGYEHLGDLGIEGREAFRPPLGPIEHHLYLCREGCLALRNHIVFRDHLRKNPTARKEYAAVKKDLAIHFCHSMDEYTQRKTGFIISVLATEGIEPENLEAINVMNTDRKSGAK